MENPNCLDQAGEAGGFASIPPRAGLSDPGICERSFRAPPDEAAARTAQPTIIALRPGDGGVTGLEPRQAQPNVRAFDELANEL